MKRLAASKCRPGPHPHVEPPKPPASPSLSLSSRPREAAPPRAADRPPAVVTVTRMGPGSCNAEAGCTSGRCRRLMLPWARRVGVLRAPGGDGGDGAAPPRLARCAAAAAAGGGAATVSGWPLKCQAASASLLASVPAPLGGSCVAPTGPQPSPPHAASTFAPATVAALYTAWADAGAATGGSQGSEMRRVASSMHSSSRPSPSKSEAGAWGTPYGGIAAGGGCGRTSGGEGSSPCMRPQGGTADGCGCHVLPWVERGGEYDGPPPQAAATPGAPGAVTGAALLRSAPPAASGEAAWPVPSAAEPAVSAVRPCSPGAARAWASSPGAAGARSAGTDGSAMEPPFGL
ncbi:hypothetical protein TSOC_004682 [Tetrabaena socialis]|uniref:Uncharacterized protein n=1 Tax=Tetrabaena socialis TaxID=47790 RepID=A0A2J8A8A1_9CHLO|nr:hypothetical protein TSOC_004682 [Tetrabaena socialis]|eukprot:PNH08741.1 hypothetical protein TSOC_004682 [Tetrabaena socialis]